MSDNLTFTGEAKGPFTITGRMPEFSSRLHFNGPAGAPIVTLTPQGKVILSEGASVDGAARVFWAAVEQMFSTDLTAARSRITELEQELAKSRK